MIYKNSWLIPANKTGVWWVQVFNVYKGSSGKVALTGDFVKVSVKQTKPNNWLKKKTKIKGILVRLNKKIQKIDGSNLRFFRNNVVILKKRLTPFGKEIFGPTIRDIKRKKFIKSFPGLL